MPLAELAAQLREASLDALDAGELTVNLRAVFACSYRALSAEAAQTFRLLGLAPGPDIGLPAATNLTGHGVEQLAELEAAHLVQQHVPGRYRMHDLVRLFAAEQAAPDDDGKALRRLVDFYLHTAHAGDHQLYRYRVRIELAAAGEGVIPLPLPDLESALAWFTAEHACLLAAQQLAVDRGWDTSAWQLAWALVSFQVRQKRTQDSVTVRRIALAAAERLGDREAVAMTHQMLGQALGSVGAAVQGLTHLRQVLVYGVEIGDVTRQAHAHRGLAWLHEQAGDLPSALSHAREQARLAATLNNRSWEATAINAMGWFEAQLGDYEAATAHCVEALTMLRAEGDLDGEANTLDSLGYIAQQTGDMAKALEHLRAATALFRRIGNSSQQVETMIRTGDCELALGLPEQARRTWEQALATSQHPQTIKTIEQRLRELADDGRR
jgi:tetratricopeptide (TPR) repeat protein